MKTYSCKDIYNETNLFSIAIPLRIDYNFYNNKFIAGFEAGFDFGGNQFI